MNWQKKDKEDKSPNLLRLISRFNQVFNFWREVTNQISNFVAVSIAKETDVKRRAAALKKFLLITEELHKLNNYNGIFEIMSGLASSAVSR